MHQFGPKVLFPNFEKKTFWTRFLLRTNFRPKYLGSKDVIDALAVCSENVAKICAQKKKKSCPPVPPRTCSTITTKEVLNKYVKHNSQLSPEINV